MTPSKRLNFWAPEEIVEKIKARGELSDQLREGMTRYYALLDYERVQIRDRFTQGELGLILDLCNGTAWTGGMIPLGVQANCEDAEEFYYERWECERKPLIDKLSALTPAQEYALVDAIERWWLAVGHGFQPPIEQLLG